VEYTRDPAEAGDTTRKRSARIMLLVAAVVGVAAILSACTDEGLDDIGDALGSVTITLPPGSGGDTQVPEATTTVVEEPNPTTTVAEEAAPTTTVVQTPTTTSPTSTTTDAGQDDAAGTSSGLLLLALVALGALVVFLLGRRSSHPSPPVAAAPVLGAVPTLRDRARSVYSEARWLLDNTDGSLIRTRQAVAAGDSQAAAADREVRRRLEAFMTDVYAAEAEAPSGSMRQALREVGAAVRDVDTTADSLTAAVPAADGSASPESVAWTTARGRLESALDRLADELRTT